MCISQKAFDKKKAFESLQVLSKYCDLLLIIFRIPEELHKDLEQFLFKEIDLDRKSFLKHVKKHNSFISQYSKYIRPKVPIHKIYEESLKVINENVLLTLSFIKSNFKILVRIYGDIPNCEIPVQLRKGSSRQDLYVIINPFCPEKIALDDAGIAFKKFELLTKRLDILSKQLENELNRGDKKDHIKIALKKTRYQYSIKTSVL